METLEQGVKYVQISKVNNKDIMWNMFKVNNKDTRTTPLA